MKTRRLTLFTVVIVIWISMLACSKLPFAQQPTYTPQATYTQQPTYTEQPTYTPIPTEAASSSAAGQSSGNGTVSLSVNGVDAIRILKGGGFVYTGGTTCSTACDAYEYSDLGLSFIAFEDNWIDFEVDAWNISDMPTVNGYLLPLLSNIFGENVVNWITSNEAAVLADTTASGAVDNINLWMGLNGENLEISLSW
jgi:hypothetical protein